MSANFLSLSINTRSAGVFLPPDILVGIQYCHQIVDCITALLVVLLWSLARPSVPCDGRGSEIFIGTHFLL